MLECLHLEALDLRVAADFLLLLGDSRRPRRLGVELELEIVRGHTGDHCEGFLSLPRGILQLATLVDCSWLGGSPSCVDCAAPEEWVRLGDADLACTSPSGCIATTRSSLPGSK